MSDHEFLFSLELSDEARFDAMLTALAAAVLGHVGYAGQTLAEIAAALHDAALAAGGHRRCDVQFRAHAGTLQIVVSSVGRPEWRTTLALPQ